MEFKHCKRCSFDWSPRIDNPKMCPRCKSRDYDKEKDTPISIEVKDANNKS